MNQNLMLVLSTFLALVVHALVAAGLMWQVGAPEPPTPTEIMPLYIDAALVAANPYTERRKLAEAERASAQATAREREKRRKAERKRRRDAAARKAAEEAQKEAEQAAKETVVEPPVDPVVEAVESPVTDSGISEAERIRREQALAFEILEEQEYRRAVTDDEKAMAYVAQIQREIIQNWSRPPSARNGMEALLRVFLVPTGEVVNVTVEQSSGNDAFDRSAVQAVQKAERFVVPAESRQFERNFREFTVLFRPEDLRL